MSEPKLDDIGRGETEKFCVECHKPIIELGFQSDDNPEFTVCKSCNDGVEADWKLFQIECADLIEHAHKHGQFCRMIHGEESND
jgi:hypothetical protein